MREFAADYSSYAVLVCGYPYGIDNLNNCDFAIHFEIPNGKHNKRRNGLVCKANRADVRFGDSAVDIIYLTEKGKSDDMENHINLKDHISSHNTLTENKAKDLEDFRKTVEEYLTILNGETNSDDKTRLDELKGE